jgi:hypothetical protein
LGVADPVHRREFNGFSPGFACRLGERRWHDLRCRDVFDSASMHCQDTKRGITVAIEPIEGTHPGCDPG